MEESLQTLLFLYAKKTCPIMRNMVIFMEGLYMNDSKVLELLGHLFLTSVTGGMWLIVLLIYHLTKK